MLINAKYRFIDVIKYHLIYREPFIATSNESVTYPSTSLLPYPSGQGEKGLLDVDVLLAGHLEEGHVEVLGDLLASLGVYRAVCGRVAFIRCQNLYYVR
jgi:hypothetical protein